MPPGYHSPFDHPQPNSPTPNPHFKATLPLLSLLLCITIILTLIFFTLLISHATASHHHQDYQQDAPVPLPHQEMSSSSSSPPSHDQLPPNYLAIPTRKDPRRATNIHDIFSHDTGDSITDTLQPLLSTRVFFNNSSDVEMATQRGDGNVQKKGSINWHGTNTLNTSWGWMA